MFFFKLKASLTNIIEGGQITKNPTVKSKTEAAMKVYSLGDHLFSVFNHKHFRIVCQQGLGNYNDQTCMHIAQITFIQENHQSALFHLVLKARN